MKDQERPDIPRDQIEALIEKWRDNAEALRTLVGNNRYVDGAHAVCEEIARYSLARQHCADDLAALLSGPPQEVDVTAIHYHHNVIIDGHDAQFWRDSYNLLRDAVVEHLGDCIREDDVAEEAILIEAIETAGKRLAGSLRDDQEG